MPCKQAKHAINKRTFRGDSWYTVCKTPPVKLTWLLFCTVVVIVAPSVSASAEHPDSMNGGSSRETVDDEKWALQPVIRPTPPELVESEWPHNAIDRFIASKLSTRHLRPSAEADRRTLIRRLSFDLLGIPPTPTEIDTFVSDRTPQAYDNLVERLLASPLYGERWARHWLDVVRFGESDGFQHDWLRPNAWWYRDWVIGALNQDMPYSEFARLQLAGDVLRPGDVSAIAATGFLVAGPFNWAGHYQGGTFAEEARQGELEDIVATVGQTFLGLTIHCARCHDHKYDPIHQSEYYRLTAALAGVHHGERDIANEALVEQVSRQASVLKANIDTLKRQMEATDPTMREDDVEQLMFEISYLEWQLAGHEKLPVTDRLSIEPSKFCATQVYAVVPQPPHEVHVLERGDFRAKGPLVTAGGVAAVPGGHAAFNLSSHAPDALRRKKLAAWVTNEQNPLFSRVIANRVWHYHFGIGLVNTPNDFGANGGRPTHPQLLDWLAFELMRHNWSLKWLHRTIVTSATYRQASHANRAAADVDLENRLLWHMQPQRLEAEVLRDTILLVSGQLNSEIGGPGYHDFRSEMSSSQLYFPVAAIGSSFNRRTIYRTWVRSGRNLLLDVFDCPDPSTQTPERAVTTTPLQALSLMNNALVLCMADHFAERLRRIAGNDVNKQVKQAYLLAYGREPDVEEIELAESFIHQHNLAAMCRVLFNSNEFLYVD